MSIPYVIDNDHHVLSKIISHTLSEYAGRSLDVATAYFTIGGFGLLQNGLEKLGSLRLLLGEEPKSSHEIGLKPETTRIKGFIEKDLENLPFGEETLRLVEDLIACLRRESVQVHIHEKGFLHAKCWIFYSDRPGQQMLFERFRPVLAIVGSSNFTVPGLTSNRELNLAHKVLLDSSEIDDPDATRAVSWLSDAKPSDRITPTNRQLLKSEVGARAIIDLERWFEERWAESRDFKEDLIALLDASKFGKKEYTPYEVYMKALFEYFKDDLEGEVPTGTRSAIDLSEFQEDAVKKARRILSRYDGVVIADSVGLGKTWIGKKLLEDFAYHMRQKALVICPASLRDMWEGELRDATISAEVHSQEELGRPEFEPEGFGDADVVLIDESHNFRNTSAQRYGSLERILSANGGKGRDGGRKKIILLTATPINNDLFDLYNQINLITQGDRGYFSACGIGDLYRYFLQARRVSRRNGQGPISLFNLLEEVVIRRTRHFIRTAYPEAKILGKKIHFPERKLRTVQYDLEATYAGIYEEVVSGIDSLKLAPYNLEDYKKAGVEVDTFEAGREKALVGIFKSRYLKRFESSIEAFRISVRRALSFIKTFESYILDGRILKSGDFQKALRYLSREDEEDDATPVSMADEMDANEEARQFLEESEEIDPGLYDLRKLHDAIQQDVEILTGIWNRVKDIHSEDDAKLALLKELLAGELRGKKVLLFTYYKDTARYLYRELGGPKGEEFRNGLDGVKVRRMDSDAGPKDRTRIVQEFAPKSNGKPDWVGTDKEIDILISTDVLSEGQNLQDCGYLVNYDLHWNPTRMVQRAGRIDRIGTEFDTLWVCNMFPDEGLERLLRLVERLSQRIADIDQLGLLDASVLGEAVNPRSFNTLRRIRDEDGTVIEEEEQFAELASSEFLSQQLRALLQGEGREILDSLPDGIHSGLIKARAKGVFFYFQARHPERGKEHFWRFYDLKDDRIIDNRFVISNLIACSKDTPRVVDPEMFAQVFDLQEKVIGDILESVQEQAALQAVPRQVDPIQQTISTAIQGYMDHPEVERPSALDAVKFLTRPMNITQVRELRRAYQDFQSKGDILQILGAVRTLQEKTGEPAAQSERSKEKDRTPLSRENLHLICMDFVSS